MGVWYCTREDVKSALDIKETARNNAQVDRAIEAGARAIEGKLHRRFYPQVDTRFFDWPNDQYARRWRLWLEENELISVTTLSSGGVVIPSTDYFLEPANSGPPFTSIELDLDSSASFGQGDSHQRDISIAGVFGHSANEAPAGALAEALDDSETEVDVTDASLVDVGTILKVDSERMIVTERAVLDTGVNLTSSNDPSMADVLFTTTDTTALHVGEVLLISAERVLVVEITTATQFIVKRAWDGSTLQALGGQDIFASRRLTVERGALGTTAAAHLTAAPLVKHVPPGLIRSLNAGEAINTIQQEQAGWGRTIGSGENEREMGGKGLADLWKQAYVAYGRKARLGAV